MQEGRREDPRKKKKKKMLGYVKRKRERKTGKRVSEREKKEKEISHTTSGIYNTVKHSHNHIKNNNVINLGK